MKKPVNLLLLCLLAIVFLSCAKDSETESNTAITGDSSPMAAVGTVVQSSSVPVAGVSNMTASVVSVSEGVSSYSGSAVVTNDVIKNILSNLPEITISGDNVSVSGFKFKQTVEGIECKNAIAPGIIVKYSSNVGDTYPVGTTGRTRTVIKKSTTDDFPYGLMNIKVIQVEEPTPALKSIGVNKMTYWANHKFGLVSVKFDLTDGTSVTFPVYTSASNN
jgi:hypothetical protein